VRANIRRQLSRSSKEATGARAGCFFAVIRKQFCAFAFALQRTSAKGGDQNSEDMLSAVVQIVE
jgi:hypothetical protein